ncbi:hypothetical protein ABPG74_014513 [Tetrahymena malaccensis]
MTENCRYAEQSQFNYHLLTIPQSNGSKLFLYYRRYAKKKVLEAMKDESKSLYDIFDQLKAEKKQNQPLNRNQKGEKEPVPEHRTLQIINFDRPFEDEQVKKWFKVMGKLRQVYTGSYKNKKAQGIAKKIYFGLVVFKNEFDMTKCFDNDLFQTKLEEYMKYQRRQQDSEGKEQYLRNLLSSYEANTIDEEKLEFLSKMEHGGFKIITDKTGEYDPKQVDQINADPTLDRYGNKKKQKNKEFQDFYKFQVSRANLADTLGMQNEKVLTDKELLKRKKQMLIEGFEQDRELLKKLKKNDD